MRHVSILVTALLACAAFAGVPLKWTVETSRLQPVALDAVHGETLDFAVAFQSYGKPLAVADLPFEVFYQTNGMGSTYWCIPATAASNVVTAVFAPTNDPGATAIRGFIGSTGNIYRAAFSIRFRTGPGAVPNVIALPPAVLDLANTQVINPPWPTDETIEDRIRSVIEEDGITAPGGMTTNDVCAIVTNDIGGSAVVGSRFSTPVVYSYTSGSVDYAITNLAVRWNGEYWEMHVCGWADRQTPHDAWYKCATTNWNDGNPYSIVNSNLNTDAVTVWIGDKTATGFSQNIGDALRTYADGTTTYTTGLHNALGLAYERNMGTTVSNIVTKSYVEGLGITGGGTTLPANYLDPATNYTDAATNALGAVLDSKASITNEDGEPVIYATRSSGPQQEYYILASSAIDAQTADHANVATSAGSASTDSSGNSIVDTYETKANVSALNLNVTTLSNTVSQWTTYWDGDDVRVTITNYNSATKTPSLYLEQKIEDNGTNYFRTVWNELTRWDAFLTPYVSFTNDVLAALSEKADRAWGYYDSHSGAYAPDGYTWISSPKIAIAADMAYQRTVTSDGAIWYLESNGLVTETGGVTSNGFFRISDDSGNELFSIVKGDKRTVGATCGSLATTNVLSVMHMYAGYAVVAENHPTIYACTNLTDAAWKAETDADSYVNTSWTGASGAYRVEVWPKSAQSALFIKATYETGGETYIRNAAPVSMQYIYLNGTNYAVGTATIGGNTVLTLTVAQ